MPKALDLRVLVERSWEVTLLDGHVLNIKKPTKRIQTLMENVTDDISVEEQLVIMNDCTIAILSNNKENYAIDEIDSEYTLDIQLAIIRGYSEWLHELLNDPN